MVCIALGSCAASPTADTIKSPKSTPTSSPNDPRPIATASTSGGGQVYFLHGVIDTFGKTAFDIEGEDTETILTATLDSLEPTDLVSINANVVFDAKSMGSEGGSSWAFIDIGLGDRLNPAVEKNYASSMTKHSMTLFGVDEPKTNSKKYKFLLSSESEQASVTVDEKASSMLLEIYRKVDPEKVNGKTPGYFLLSYDKLQKTEVKNLVRDGEEVILTRELPLEDGDLVLVTANISWKNAGDQTACKGAVFTYSLQANEDQVGHKVAVEMGDFNLDDSTLKFFKYDAKGKTRFDISAVVESSSDCSVTVDGYSSMYFRVFRPLRKLNTKKNRAKAYYLFEQSYSNEGAGAVKTVKNGELEIFPVFTKEVELLENEVIVYDVLARAKSENGAASRVLIQLEHAKRNELSPVARTGMGSKFQKSLLYLSNGIFTDRKITEEIVLKAGGYHAEGKLIKMDDIHFRYQIYSKLP